MATATGLTVNFQEGFVAIFEQWEEIEELNNFSVLFIFYVP